MSTLRSSIPNTNGRVRRSAPGPRLVVINGVRIDNDEPIAELPTFLQVLWPVLFGILLAFAAQWLWNWMNGFWGDEASSLFFPFAALVRRFWLAGQSLAATLTRWMVYLQFPIDALIVVWSQRGRNTFRGSLSRVAFLHGTCIFVLWLAGQPHAPSR